MVGGVATNKGDFRWTRMVERCLVAGEEEVPDVGEKAAVVGGLGSSLDFPGAVSGPRAGDEVISAIQGVSAFSQPKYLGKTVKRSSRCPKKHTKRSHTNPCNLGI